MTREVTVEKISRKGTSFVSEDTWYNFKRKGKEAKLPNNIKEGTQLEITEYEESGKSVYFTRYEVTSEGSNDKPSKNEGKSASKGDYKKSSGGGYGQKDPTTQRSIVVQSMVKAAVELVASGNNPEGTSVIDVAEELIAYHDKKLLELDKPPKEAASNSKPKKTRKPKEEMIEEPEPEEDEDDVSDDDPDFDI